jgi:hypothetical protein
MAVSKASLRGLRFNERMAKMQEANKQQAARIIRVTPANDDMRRLLRHPRAGGFPASGAVDWPDDRFTHRRIADGDIKVEQAQAQKEPPDKRSHRKHEDNNAA